MSHSLSPQTRVAHVPTTRCIRKGGLLQAQQACLDEERRTCTKLAKRLERVETARRKETTQLRDELARVREAAAEAEAGHREAVQQRDVQLVVAESKAAAQRSQLEQQEQEVRRMQEQVATRERELSTVHEERLNLELKQQQLRYDRRLQVCCQAGTTSIACIALGSYWACLLTFCSVHVCYCTR